MVVTDLRAGEVRYGFERAQTEAMWSNYRSALARVRNIEQTDFVSSTIERPLSEQMAKRCLNGVMLNVSFGIDIGCERPCCWCVCMLQPEHRLTSLNGRNEYSPFKLRLEFISALLTTSSAYRLTCKKLFAAYSTIACRNTSQVFALRIEPGHADSPTTRFPIRPARKNSTSLAIRSFDASTLPGLAIPSAARPTRSSEYEYKPWSCRTKNLFTAGSATRQVGLYTLSTLRNAAGITPANQLSSSLYRAGNGRIYLARHSVQRTLLMRMPQP